MSILPKTMQIWLTENTARTVQLPFGTNQFCDCVYGWMQKPSTWVSLLNGTWLHSMAVAGSRGCTTVTDRQTDHATVTYITIGSTAFSVLPNNIYNNNTNSGISFLNEQGRRLTDNSGDSHERMYLFQRVCPAVQHYNSAAFKRTFSLPT